jgi:hypothetical protein
MTDSKKLLFRTGNSDLPPGVVDPRPAAIQAQPVGGEVVRPPAGGAAY